MGQNRSESICPIAPGTKSAQWSKYLSCSIGAHPSGTQFCGTKRKKVVHVP